MQVFSLFLVCVFVCVPQSFPIRIQALPRNQLNPWLFDKERAYFQPVTVLWQGGKKGRDLIKAEIVRD